MKILFLGDIVGNSGCEAVRKYLPKKIEEHQIDFVIANGENAAIEGVGITEEISNNLFNCGVNVITTGNHVWDQKNIMNFIDKENRLLRPKNLFEPAPGKGFEIYTTSKDIKIGVLEDIHIIDSNNTELNIKLFSNPLDSNLFGVINF